MQCIAEPARAILTSIPTDGSPNIINDLDLTVTVCAFDAGTGALNPIQTHTTLPKDVVDRSGYSCADIHVSPDGRFVYGSNRGHHTIAIFSIDQDSGRLTAAGHASTRGRTPRNFTLDPTGAWLLAANQDSDDISVFSAMPTAANSRPSAAWSGRRCRSA